LPTFSSTGGHELENSETQVKVGKLGGESVSSYGYFYAGERCFLILFLKKGGRRRRRGCDLTEKKALLADGGVN